LRWHFVKVRGCERAFEPHGLCPTGDLLVSIGSVPSGRERLLRDEGPDWPAGQGKGPSPPVTYGVRGAFGVSWPSDSANLVTHSLQMKISVSLAKSWGSPGLRRSVVMSDFIEGDPEGGEGSGGIAGVVAEGSGEVDGPARLSTPIARLRRHAMMCGPVPVRTWGASSAKVTPRTQCREGVAVQTAYGLVQCAADH
jgi:hypothetical protein